MRMSTHAFGGRTHDFGIADRLRAAREDAGMDQRMFAERTGLSRATISNYERGIHKPRRPQLVVWALATGFSLHWLEQRYVSTGCHSLRHRFATRVYDECRDLLVVQELLGHSKPETTQQYVKLPTDAMRDAMRHAA